MCFLQVGRHGRSAVGSLLLYGCVTCFCVSFTSFSMPRMLLPPSILITDTCKKGAELFQNTFWQYIHRQNYNLRVYISRHPNTPTWFNNLKGNTWLPHNAFNLWWQLLFGILLTFCTSSEKVLCQTMVESFPWTPFSSTRLFQVCCLFLISISNFWFHLYG